MKLSVETVNIILVVIAIIVYIAILLVYLGAPIQSRGLFFWGVIRALVYIMPPFLLLGVFFMIKDGRK